MTNTIIQIYKNKSSVKLPAIHFPAGLQQHELIHPDLIKAAAELFSVNGVLTIHQLFPKIFIDQLHSAFVDRYHHYFGLQEYANALNVGDKRRMLTVDFQAPFNHPDLYGNPFLLYLMRSLLGDGFVLGSLGAVIALPGAAHQHIHRDHPSLFDDESVDLNLPSFAITVVVPLVDLTTETGSTRVWKGSHRQSHSVKTDMADSFVPLVPTGSCYLMDYQLLHGGTANQSNIVRPILYLIYHRSWFQEAVNYEKQARLAIAPPEYSAIPEPYRFLFKHVRIESTQPDPQSCFHSEKDSSTLDITSLPDPLKPDLSEPSVSTSGVSTSVLPKRPVISSIPQKFAQLSAEEQVYRLAKVARKALEQYGFTSTDDIDMELVHHGENTTFAINITDSMGDISAIKAISPEYSSNPKGYHGIYHHHRFVLRVSRASYLTLETIESELQWLHDLSQMASFAVPIPIPTMAGPFAAWAIAPDLLGEQAEGRACTLMRWINGDSFDIENPLDCQGMDKLEVVGRILGHLHHCASSWSRPNTFFRPTWNWNGLFKEYAGYSNNGEAVWARVPPPYHQLFEWVGEQTKAAMDALGNDASQFGLIHGDFWQGNLLWKDGRIGLIDFADCGWGYWGYDIARFLSDFAFSSTTAPSLQLFLNKILDGYEQVRSANSNVSWSLPADQRSSIPLFMAAQQATFGLWCIHRAQDHPVFRANLEYDLQAIASNIDVALNMPWS